MALSISLSAVFGCDGSGTGPDLDAMAAGSVEVSPTRVFLMEGLGWELTATAYTKGGLPTTRPVEWSTSDARIARVDDDGRITAVAPGQATITARLDKASGTAEVTVVDDWATLPVAGEREEWVAVVSASGSVPFNLEMALGDRASLDVAVEHACEIAAPAGEYLVAAVVVHRATAQQAGRLVPDSVTLHVWSEDPGAAPLHEMPETRIPIPGPGPPDLIPPPSVRPSPMGNAWENSESCPIAALVGDSVLLPTGRDEDGRFDWGTSPTDEWWYLVAQTPHLNLEGDSDRACVWASDEYLRTEVCAVMEMYETEWVPIWEELYEDPLPDEDGNGRMIMRSAWNSAVGGGGGNGAYAQSDCPGGWRVGEESCVPHAGGAAVQGPPPPGCAGGGCGRGEARNVAAPEALGYSERWRPPSVVRHPLLPVGDVRRGGALPGHQPGPGGRRDGGVPEPEREGIPRGHRGPGHPHRPRDRRHPPPVGAGGGPGGRSCGLRISHPGGDRPSPDPPAPGRGEACRESASSLGFSIRRAWFRRNNSGRPWIDSCRLLLFAPGKNLPHPGPPRHLGKGCGWVGPGRIPEQAPPLASRILRFFAEWRRRKVSRAAVVYVVGGLATIEAINNILPNFGLDRFIPAVLTLVFLGFPLTLVLSWIFEISGGAIRRTAPLEALEPGEEDKGRGSGSEAAPPLLDLPEAGAEGLPPQRVHERRRVSVVAARIEGYLSLSEALELEDFEGVRQRIREAAEEVASRYEGCVHGFSAETLTLFLGLPRSHEDDAVRAVRAALDFRRWVQESQGPVISNPGPPSEIQPRLDTRTAILAGPLVVEGCLDDGSPLEVTGDVHLLAARLAESAGPGTLLVGSQVREQAEGQFEFEELPPVLLKGRTEPIEISRFTAARQTPTTVHGRVGEAPPLVGRKPELQELQRGRERLAAGKGSVVAVAGAAGTGKSRLVSEFKQGLDPSETGWVEGHAFPFSRDIPYSIIMDLLGRCWGIEDTDNAGALRAKIRMGIESIGAGILASEPYVGSLFSLDYSELEDVQPELWKERLHSGVLQILSALARAKPTVFFLEDLHWADGASLELIRYLTREFRSPAILLCAYRQTDFEPFSDALKASLGAGFREVELKELSSSEAHAMVETLLESDTLPTSLTDFLAEKAEGNPFFIEEAVHSLVEKGDLVRSGGDWTLNRSLAEFEVPSTVHGLLLSRVDRLNHRVRQVLQEASVIGRVFPLRLLKRVTENPSHLDRSLSTLEELGLIHHRKGGGEAEYIFHHALGQEVVYGTLVRGDRRRIHRAVGVALEELFADRIAEFHETLAYHFKRGHASLKAVRYLSLAGEKSWRRYSLEESNRFFTEAYELLSSEEDRTQEENTLLLAILNNWAIVFNHLGDYRTLARILRENEGLARSLSRSSPVEVALVFGWLGYGFQCQEELEKSYRYLEEALALARTANDPEAIAYVSAWTARTCVDMGRLDEALAHGGRAEKLAEGLPSDAKLFRFTYSALGLAHYFRGDRAAVEGVAEKFLAFGERHTDLRSLLLGHVNEGNARIIAGDFQGAIERLQKALGVSVDPMYSMYARLMLGVSYASEGMLTEAEETLNEVIQFDAENDFNLLGTTARGMFSIALLSKGDLAGGVGVAEEVIRSYEEKGNHYRHALQEYMLGTFYLRLVRKEGRGGVAFMAKNVGFLLRNLPHARDKAEAHLSRSTEIASRIGAHGVLGQAFLALGQLYAADGQPEQASAALEKARAEFEWCGAEVYLEKVVEAESRVLLLS